MFCIFTDTHDLISVTDRQGICSAKNKYFIVLRQGNDCALLRIDKNYEVLRTGLYSASELQIL